jgi:hypothetical protein
LVLLSSKRVTTKYCWGRNLLADVIISRCRITFLNVRIETHCRITPKIIGSFFWSFFPFLLMATGALNPQVKTMDRPFMTRRFRKCLRHVIYERRKKERKKKIRKEHFVYRRFFFTQQQQHSTLSANKHTHHIDNQHNIKQYTTNTTNTIQV